jgi:hypothetical protein
MHGDTPTAVPSATALPSQTMASAVWPAHLVVPDLLHEAWHQVTSALPCVGAAGGGKPGAALAVLGQLHGLAVGTAGRAAAALPGPTPQQLRAFAAALFSPFEAQLTRCRNCTATPMSGGKCDHAILPLDADSEVGTVSDMIGDLCRHLLPRPQRCCGLWRLHWT